MSDERLLALRRAWESGDASAGAGYLQACVRSGALAQDRLEVAAYAGDAAAASACDVDVPDELGDWILGFREWDDEAFLRSVVYAVEVSVPVYEAAAPGDELAGDLVARFLALLDAGAGDLGPELFQLTQAFMGQLLDRGAKLGRRGAHAGQAIFALSLQLSGRLRGVGGPPPGADSATWVRRTLAEPLDDPQGLLLAVHAAANATEPDAVRRWTGQRLAAWALGPCALPA